MAHLRAYVGFGTLAHHLAFLVRHLGANMTNNSKQNAFVEPTSLETAPKMPQPPFPSTPKVQKTKENLTFFKVFHSPAMVPKSIKNAPRTAPEAPKLSPTWQSCRYHGPSYSLCWLILELLPTILPSLFAILVTTCRTIRSKMQSSSQHRWRQPPKCLSNPFQAPQKCRKPKKTYGFSMFFALQPWCQSRSKMLPEPTQKLPS